MGYLVLVRHGESRWNASNKFTGWVDVPLSATGVLEAQIASQKLSHLSVDVAFTSKLIRAQATLLVILADQQRTGIFIHEDEGTRWHVKSSRLGKQDIPVYMDMALNERYYGELQGMDKERARKKYGKKNVFKWRRSYDQTPPLGESLMDMYHRVTPYFKKRVMGEVRKNKNVVVATHGNTLRAIIKYIEKISDENIPYLEVQTAKPIIYLYTKGKLKRKSDKFSFERPIYWNGPENSKRRRRS